jgi:predicted Zn-dependent protease
MQKKLIFEATLLILIFGSIWGIFTVLPIWPQKSFSGISVEKEEKLGKLLLNTTLAGSDFEEVRNDTVTAALDSISLRLTAALDDSRYTYRIIVVKSSMANAFALPGGYVVITDKLIGMTESPEECAAVLAHEIGHIQKRHTLSKLLANFTASLIFGDNELAAEAAELLATSAYSRRQEETADQFGLNLLEKSGINPHIMGTAFRHLKEESDYSGGKMEIIMSHPDMDSRIKNAYDYRVNKDFTENKFTINWNTLKSTLIPLKSQ